MGKGKSNPGGGNSTSRVMETHVEGVVRKRPIICGALIRDI